MVLGKTLERRCARARQKIGRFNLPIGAKNKAILAVFRMLIVFVLHC